jgi:hypothetical protein
MTRTSDRPTVEAFAAVLFDMDGTLVDSDAAVERPWRASVVTSADVAGKPDPEGDCLEGGAGGVADFPLATLTDLIPTP